MNRNFPSDIYETSADFAVKDKRIAIYIDRASVHVGRAERRDCYIRSHLRNSNPPWTVIELMAKDLNRTEEIVKDILSQSVWEIVQLPKRNSWLCFLYCSLVF